MGVLADAGRHARSAAADARLMPPALVAIDRLLEMARDAHADLRRIVSDARRPRRRLAAFALAGRARSTRARRSAAALRCGPRGWRLRPVHTSWCCPSCCSARWASCIRRVDPEPALAVPFWLALAALLLSLSL